MGTVIKIHFTLFMTPRKIAEFPYFENPKYASRNIYEKYPWIICIRTENSSNPGGLSLGSVY